MPKKLNVAFLWHMHQPFYRDPANGRYALPWARLHGIKGYTDMLEAVRRCDNVRVTFNLVPCLVQQISDLASGKEADLYFELSTKPANDLDPAEKNVILKHFFSANLANMILPYPRYRDLLNRRGRRLSEDALASKAKTFTSQEFRDLQVWFNLTWFGWASEQRHSLIGELKRKDRDFSEQEKSELLALQIDVLKEAIPAYKDAWREKRVDISTTPYYHPILPLIIDQRSARISQPKDPMPAVDFIRPTDAMDQLQKGRSYVKEQLGREPTGLWPSEGSVSPAVCELASQIGFEWLATDEGVLLGTMPGKKREAVIYQTYRAFENGPTLIFRDRFLSDAIGFRYAGNKPERAVDDFVGHLQDIADSFSNPDEKIVAVILDGENAWEYFPDGGERFLNELYSRLLNHDCLRLTTITQYVKDHPAKTVLPPIFPASWISGSFRIWIGDPIKNTAWERMAQTASALDESARNGADPRTIESAKQWLYVAEGSDWFWWYGQPNFSEFEPEFDYLFRANLMQVYKELNLPVPQSLLRPISKEQLPEETMPLFPMKPTIDGKETNFYEWVGARSISVDSFSGSMNLSGSLIEKLWYGISETHLFLRLDPSEEFLGTASIEVLFKFSGALEKMLVVGIQKRGKSLKTSWQCNNPPRSLPELAFDRILEIKIPFEDLTLQGHEVLLAVIVRQNDLDVERWPREGYYSCPWPTVEYLSANWVV